MLASSALNNLFVTYHLDFYLTVVRLRPSYFYLGHAVFMVWNAVNDVLFGWLSDTLPLSRGGRRSPMSHSSQFRMQDTSSLAEPEHA